MADGTLPGERDINIYGSLDEITAVRHFLGRTLSEAEALFRENGFTYQEDLMWMGPRAFAYYLPAALNYLRGPHSVGDEMFVDCLHMVIAFRSDEDSSRCALGTVRELVDYVLDNWAAKFLDKDDPITYRDAPEKYQQLKRKLDSRS